MDLEKAERKKKQKELRTLYDTIMEGVGCDRVTDNFALAPADLAFRVSDDDSVAMARHLLDQEGLFVGGSAAMNCVAAVRTAQQMGPGHTIVTVLCDGGQRYLQSVHATTAAGGDAQHAQG